jgi:hypothetical protein
MALRGEIATLYRRVDRQLVLLTALRDDVRGLAGPGSGCPAGAGDRDDGGGPVAVYAHATVRVDHLGASTFVAKGWSAISLGD